MRDSKSFSPARALFIGSVCSVFLTTACGAADEVDYGETSTLLSGELAELGELEPTVSSLVIENSGEILIYLSSAEITCAELMTSRWLGDVEDGAQVVEIVVPSELATPGSVDVGAGAEVNYAAGGMSSAYERSASAGYVTFTKGLPDTVEGSFMASYAGPVASVEGRFQAEFCDGGQGY